MKLRHIQLSGKSSNGHEPLIRIIPDHNTGEDACYFYNRLEGDQVRWVSYHYRGEPELLLPDPYVTKFLSSLMA